MAAQLNNKEKEVYRQAIKEEIQKDKNTVSLKIVWHLRTIYNQRRHHQTIQWGFVNRMRKIIEGEEK